MITAVQPQYQSKTRNALRYYLFRGDQSSEVVVEISATVKKGSKIKILRLRLGGF
jgi:hypothetical protein